jgi:polyisoprenyl-phosphate glycosyltransferase
MSGYLDLSVVVPCFNEEEGLLEFHRRMMASCAESGVASYEIIYVNDGSSDGTFRIMRDLQCQNHFVRVIDLARNHGHQIALSAGLAHARGECVLTIDADLQDPPELLPLMMRKIQDGADVVYAQRRVRRGESVFKRATAFVFYRLLGRIGGTPIPVDTGDFRLMRREVVDVLVKMPEAHRFVRGLVAWIGFAQVPIRYDRDARFAGTTKYPFLKMLAFSIDAITSFAMTPLRIVFAIAMCALVMAGLMLGWTLYSFLYLNAVPGWSSMMTIFLFFTSVQLFALAMIGEYVGRIFMESKRRPLYVIRSIYPPMVSADTGKPADEHQLRRNVL